MADSKLQVLMATMNLKDRSIVDQANLQSNAIIINQSDKFDYDRFNHGSNEILIITLPERGVGLSRNTALMRTNSDIAVFADHDIVYRDGYEQIVLDAFDSNPKADMIMFDVRSLNPERPTKKIVSNGRVRRYNSLRYGAVNMAVRLERVQQVNVVFSLLFGGGAKYSSGEDSLFLYQCIKRGLKVYRSTHTIADVRQDESTWFEGYTDKFFYDKGALFKAISPRLYWLFILQFVIRKSKSMAAGRSYAKCVRLMMRGAGEYR